MHIGWVANWQVFIYIFKKSRFWDPFVWHPVINLYCIIQYGVNLCVPCVCILYKAIHMCAFTYINALWGGVETKEVIKEQSTPANLSATARRVLRCTRSQKPSCSFKEIFFGYFHRTVPETPSQIGFKSVKQKVENYTLGHFKIQNGGF
jgi:hypothetical protein